MAWAGFKQLGYLYDRDPRFRGKTNFTITKYFKFGFSGITSFSDRPLYLASYLGAVITVVGFIFATWMIILKIYNPAFSIRGWTSLSAMVIFFGGVQLSSIGTLGIYISKIFHQVKNRPLYIIKKEIGFE